LDIYVNKDTDYRHQQTADRVANALISVSQQSEMTWTKEIPDKEGDYRVKNRYNRKWIITVYKSTSGVLKTNSPDGAYLLKEYINEFELIEFCFIPMSKECEE
jgi:hypothetical protein